MSLKTKKGRIKGLNIIVTKTSKAFNDRLIKCHTYELLKACQKQMKSWQFVDFAELFTEQLHIACSTAVTAAPNGLGINQ